MLNAINKMLLFFKYIFIGVYSFFILPHPFYLGVTELKYNQANKSLQISCKLFTNDLEDALSKTSGKSVDLLHPKNKTEVEKILFDYITKRLSFSINGNKKTINYIGFEKEEEAIWTYMEIQNCEIPKKVIIENKLLYDFLKEQINIVHLEVSNFKESSKVTNPESKLEFIIP